MQIEILSVSKPTFHQTAQGGYNKVEVAFKNEHGEIKGKSIVDWTNKNVYEYLTNTKQGDRVEITAEQSGKFWNWVDAKSAGSDSTPAQGNPGPASDNNRHESGGRPAAAARGRVAGSNYETPEERAIRRAFEVKKHRQIGRQGCINAAINTISRDGTKELDIELVLRIAKTYEEFVFGEEQSGGQGAVGEKIPF